MPANKIKLEICGSNYVIATTDTEEYVLSLAEKLDSDMTQMLASNPTASVTTAAVITALGYLDELKKSTSGADNMRAQIKDYLEDAAKAKLAAEAGPPRGGAPAPRDRLFEREEVMPSHSNSTRPEILAPAGNADMLCAAVFAGADAVYLGLQNFNARRTAGNFTTEGLRQAVAFCHARDVRVYVTLNTTLYPGELTALAEAVAGIAAAGADAVITQGSGRGRACAPNGAGPGAARLHADERAEPGRCAPSGRAGFYTRDFGA